MEEPDRQINYEPDISEKSLLELLKPAKLYGDEISLLTESSIVTEPDIIEIDDPFKQNIFIPSIDFSEVYNAEIKELTVVEQYKLNCHEYNTPPLSLVTNVLSSDGETLSLDNYGPDEVNLYLIFKAMTGPPVSQITSVNLSNNIVSKDACITLADFIRMSAIETLNLSNTQIGPEGMEVLAESIEYSEYLKELNLSKCDLRDVGGAAIATAVATNDSIKRLYLSHNKLCNEAAIELGTMLSQNSTLEILDLHWNEINPELPGAKLMSGLRRNKSLKELNLSWNGFCGERISESIGHALRFHRFLEVINLENNVFSPEDLLFIIASLKRSKSLREVYMGGNLWTNDTISAMLKGDIINIKIISFGKYFYFPTPMYNLLLKYLELYPDLIIISHGKELPNPPEPVNVAHMLLDRCKFLAMKPKRKAAKRNMGFFMLTLSDLEDDYMKYELFEEKLKAFRAKLDPDLERDLKAYFTEKLKVGKFLVRKINTRKMAETYLERHPTERPPVVEPKVVAPKPKKPKSPKK